MNEESIKIYLYLHKWAEGGIIKVNKILDILSAVGGNNERNITSQSVRV